MDSLEPNSLPSSASPVEIHSTGESQSSDNYEDAHDMAVMHGHNSSSLLLAAASSGQAGSTGSVDFPWKQRQVLTFDIPVHDTERAGLGVSVKGKTTSSSSGSSQWVTFEFAT